MLGVDLKKPRFGAFLNKWLIKVTNRLISRLQLWRRGRLNRFEDLSLGRGLCKEGQDGGQNHESRRDRISHTVIARAISNPSGQNGAKNPANAVGGEKNSVIQSKILRSPVVRTG